MMSSLSTRTLLFTAFATTLACSLSGALFLACSSKDSDKNAENGGAGGDTGTTGGKQSGDETAVGASCTSTADCENADTEHCTVSCENVAGKKRCVTRSVDADGDGEGTSACTAAPGVDCDDADVYSSSGGAALAAMGSPLCANKLETCSSALGRVVWFSEDAPWLVLANSNGSYGGFEAHKLGADGQQDPDGSPVTSWTISGAGASSLGVLNSSQDFAVVRGGSSTQVGLLWSSAYKAGVSQSGVRFATATLGEASTGTVVVPGSAFSTYDIPYSVATFRQLVLYQSSSNWYSAAGEDRGSAADVWRIGGLRTDPVVAPTGVAGALFDLVPGEELVPTGTQWLVAGRNAYSSMGASYDPALVARIYQWNLQAQVGSDLVLIDNSATANIDPTVASLAVADGFVIFFRDQTTGIPLSAKHILSDGTAEATKTFPSLDMNPLSAFDGGDLGMTVVGLRWKGTVGSSEQELVMQRFSSSLELLGSALVLDTLSAGTTMNWGDTTRLRGFGRRLSLNWGGSEPANSSKYQLLRINSCQK